MSNSLAQIEHLSVFVKIIYHNWHGIKMTLNLHHKLYMPFLLLISKIQIHSTFKCFFRDFSLQVAQNESNSASQVTHLRDFAVLFSNFK